MFDFIIFLLMRKVLPESFRPGKMWLHAYGITEMNLTNTEIQYTITIKDGHMTIIYGRREEM